ncbi:MAG TPA: hypothetical protein ENK07_09060, partial [Bacteroidetes bacterium]|nr:hypothetical protein [Bacteroidota bacterium]
MTIGKGYTDRALTDEEVYDLARAAFDREDLDGKRVIVLLPDTTRTAPVPLFFRMLTDLLLPRVAKLDFLIALGTHPVMSWERILKHLGVSEGEWNQRYSQVQVFNHHW